MLTSPTLLKVLKQIQELRDNETITVYEYMEYYFLALMAEHVESLAKEGKTPNFKYFYESLEKKGIILE